jgi:hypothetical protein
VTRCSTTRLRMRMWMWMWVRSRSRSRGRARDGDGRARDVAMGADARERGGGIYACARESMGARGTRA